MDDIERIQAYILGQLAGDPQEKEDIITAIDENRGADGNIIETVKTKNLKSRFL